MHMRDQRGSAADLAHVAIYASSCTHELVMQWVRRVEFFQGAGMRWVMFTVIVAIAAGAAALARGRAKRGHLDVGAVSDDWIAHHRSEPPS